MTILLQEFDDPGVPSLWPYLNSVLENGLAEHVKVKWGKSERYVIIIEGKRYQYKGGHGNNKNVGKKIIALYISMSDKSSNKETNTVKKNEYTHDLNKELKDLDDGKDTNVQINLEQITVKQAITLIQLNVQGKRVSV